MDEAITYQILSPENAHHLHGCDVFDKSVDPDQLAAFLADPGHDLVFATMGTKVVGMASGTVLFHPDKRPAFFINEVGVNEEARRRGIATALCTRLLDLARQRGCHEIWLATETDNIEARGLYRKLGGREVTGVVAYEWGGSASP